MRIEWDKLTEEQREQGRECVKFWIANALATGRMTDEEKQSVHDNIHKLYKAGKCKPPKAVVVVPSPYTMAMAGGAAAWYWYRQQNPKVDPKLEPAKEVSPLGLAERREALRAATLGAPDKELDALLQSKGAQLCAKRWHAMRQGGNMWAGWLCVNQFARDVCGFEHPSHKNYQCWEDLAKVSGFRIVHEDFAMVSEKPIKLETYVDERGTHVPHCVDGPSHLWADGFSIYHIDGVRLPAWIVEQPELITVEKIDAEESREIQLVMRGIYGEEKYLVDTGATVIDEDVVPCERINPDSALIPRALVEDKQGNRKLIAGDGSTKKRTFVMDVPRETKTCVEAEWALTGLDPAKQFARS